MSRTPRRAVLALLLGGLALAGAAQGALAQGGNARLTVVNRSNEMVDLLHVSPSSSNNWGSDLLGRLQLLPGSGVAVNFAADAECRQDVRVTYHNRTEEMRMRVDACTRPELVFDGSKARPANQRAPQPAR